MKRSLLVLVLLAVAVVSCDRRGSSRDKLNQSIEQFSAKQGQITSASYYPEYYTEVRTDSVIDNTFKVSIKNFSVMDSEILVKTTSKDRETIINYHRVFASEIQVSYANKLILDTMISAQQFAELEQQHFWEHATLEHVWVNEEDSHSDLLKLNMSFINPKNNSYKLYAFEIDPEGKQRYRLIEEHS